MTFPLFLVAKDRTVQVVGYVDKNVKKGVFVDGKGYIDEDDHIWIYSSSGKPSNSNEFPYFWFNKDDEKEFSHPSVETLSTFVVDNLKDMKTDVIVENTIDGEELYSEQAINDMNASAEVFVPTFKESDDFLKKIIKRLIVEKGIDISRLKYKMPEKYILPNMKAALQNDTKMSVVYFVTWCELLGVDFTIVVEDNGTDPMDQLKKPLFYESRRDKVLREDEMDS